MAAFTATRTAYLSCDGVKHFFDSPTVKQLYSYLSPLSISVCRLHLGKADTLALIFHCELVTFCKQKYIFYIIIFESLIPLTPTALFFFIGMSVNGNFKNTPFSVCTITFWLLSTTSSSLISPSSENFE